MALSLSPPQVIHTPSLPSAPLQSFSTPRQFTTHETLLKNHTQPLLLNQIGHVHATPGRDEDKDLNKFASTPTGNRAVPVSDLPSWTPLRLPANGGDTVVSDSEVDESSTGNLETERPTLEVNAGVESAKRAPERSPDASPSKKKKARFAGVFISTKPPPYKKVVSPTRPRPANAARARTQEFSLVDALSRTFDANKYVESPLRPPPRAIYLNRRRRGGDAETDADTTTEADDEQLQLNTRLARAPLTKPHARTRRGGAFEAVSVSAHASETNSEPDAGGLRDRFERFERPVKRLKAIQYDSNVALIDAALGTVEAPISLSWNRVVEPENASDVESNWDEEDVAILAETARVAGDATDFENVKTTTERNHRSPSEQLQQPGLVPTTDPSVLDVPLAASVAPAPSAVSNDAAWCGKPTSHGSGKNPKPVLSPYLSRGAKFRQRLAAMFGDDATVRRDKTARPRPADLEFYVSHTDDPVDRAPSPNPSESTRSVTSVSSMALEEGAASAIPNTHITGQSPDDLFTTTTNAIGGFGTAHGLVEHPAPATSDNIHSRGSDDQQLDGPHDVGIAAMPLPTATTDAGEEEQIRGWMSALHRLIKGKVRINEETLESLSIVLAEIESVKDSLDKSILTTSELRESVRQLSELYDIPFGDRNRLRQRAEVMLQTWPLMAEPGAR